MSEELIKKRIGLGDTYGTAAEVNCDPTEEDPLIQLTVGIGQCQATGYPTPTAARQLAAALLDAAEAVEATG